MSCKRLPKYALLIVFAFACSRESASPEQAPAPASPSPEVAKVSTAPTEPAEPRYDESVRWFRVTPGFHFVVEEDGVRAEGDMTRPRIGAEEVRVAVKGDEWTAKTDRNGVTWQKAGKDAAPPPWGSRLFQRVTVAFDPQKTEGDAQVVEPRHFRFTDANSGAVHDVWVDEAGRIAKITIGRSFSMVLTAQQ
jgi:hypothetical protein